MTLLSSEPYHRLNLRAGDQPLQVPLGDAGTLGGVLSADGTFLSGHSAPFGGPSFTDPRVAPDAVAHGVDGALAQLHAAGASTVTIKLPPPSYAEALAPFTHALLQRGFAVADTDLTYVVDVAAPEDVLRASARRAARRGEDLVLTGAASVDEAWAIIERNRVAKGYALALDAAYVRRALDTLGEEAVRLRVLRSESGDGVAAALLYDVADGIELLVAWGDEPGLRPSPMYRLAWCVLADAMARGTRLLDLGAATLPAGGRPVNAGLAEFKRHAGGRAETRLTLTRSES